MIFRVFSFNEETQKITRDIWIVSKKNHLVKDFSGFFQIFRNLEKNLDISGYLRLRSQKKISFKEDFFPGFSRPRFFFGYLFQDICDLLGVAFLEFCLFDFSDFVDYPTV